MSSTSWKIGKATFTVQQEDVAFEGKPMRSEDSQVGTLTSYRVETTDLSTIIFGIVTWADGETEVIPIEVLKSSEQKYGHLGNAGRMAVKNIERSWVAELNSMKFNSQQGKANLASATLDELKHFAEADIQSVLGQFGKVEIATKEVLIGETNKNRNRLALKCEQGNKNMLAAAYVVTRVLAILKDFGM
jgi:hypothetical protein